MDETFTVRTAIGDFQVRLVEAERTPTNLAEIVANLTRRAVSAGMTTYAGIARFIWKRIPAEVGCADVAVRGAAEDFDDAWRHGAD